MTIFEKQCKECGLIWEDTQPIQADPFICPNCQRQMRWNEYNGLSKAKKTLLRNKEKYRGV